MPYGIQRQAERKASGSWTYSGWTTTEYLLGSSGAYVVEAHEKGGAKAARDIDELVSEVTGMFAGGQLSEEALEGAMKALNDAYWMAKEKNKKYGRRKSKEVAQD